MTAINFVLNGEDREVDDLDPNTPLLWVLRDRLDMVGTKFGCGRGLCGACTVHFNGNAMRSCLLPISAVAGQEITTIEGLAETDDSGNEQLHPLQNAWIASDTPQCGYCQAGQIMTAAALLKANPNPSDADIDNAMAGNLCRCGTYKRIRQAIHTAAENSASGGTGE
ncbi:(2Fe-2S)-binding protein [Microbulbifer agarilyticus]|uniref:(2Fe-2S)-binding protein n=1 Tax=Microbulbifer agarilyticus TaxID=260552 RepID=UPI001C95EDF0|nr:(2Fe-2S)-binding protein [Microbulbifer agarilyticus]MBY6210929.1 (2Fe-2S)-binding protein [Microbulbifer agarilyticus]MCA0892155.1 (2Fe-2S)-binding protein [Microbulbifer agarilyticus]